VHKEDLKNNVQLYKRIEKSQALFRSVRDGKVNRDV